MLQDDSRISEWRDYLNIKCRSCEVSRDLVVRIRSWLNQPIAHRGWIPQLILKSNESWKSLLNTPISKYTLHLTWDSQWNSYIIENNCSRDAYRQKHEEWRHNERKGISNHRRLDCLLKRLFRRILEKKIQVPRLWPLWGELIGHRWIHPKKGQVTQKMRVTHVQSHQPCEASPWINWVHL